MKIEKIQERGIRMVHNDYTASYNDLLQDPLLLTWFNFNPSMDK